MRDRLQESHQQLRQVIGLSLPPDLASEVKAEAARRKISLKRLFIEMWALYRARNPGAGVGDD